MIILSAYLLVGFLVSVFLLSSSSLLSANKKFKEQFDIPPSKGVQNFAVTLCSLLWFPLLCIIAIRAFRDIDKKSPKRIILGLSGLAGSGKSTFAKELTLNHKFTELAFGDNLKKLLAYVFEDDINEYYTDSGKRGVITQSITDLNDSADRLAKYLKDELNVQDSLIFANRFVEVLNEPQMHEVIYTRRELMQLVGTDVIKHLDSEFWINIVLKDAELIEGDIVVSDVRFDDEGEAIQKLEGFNVYIERKGLKKLEHSSEKGLSVGLLDAVIHNNDDLESIPSLVETLLKGARNV